ncbi:hypothetical protein NMG60_11014089 [Bertholletia excelsa]
MRQLNIVFPTLVLLFLLSISTHQACRHLEGEKDEWMKKESLLLQSLQRDSGNTGPFSNPSTYIPTSSTTKTVATIGQRGFVGHTTPPPPMPHASRDPQAPILLTSLQRGPVTPSTPNPGTNIPASSSTRIVATIGQKGFAGHSMPPPPISHTSHGSQIPILLTSLQKAPVTPSTSNPGTNIPASSTTRITATIGQRGFAGHTIPSPPMHYISHNSQIPTLLTSLQKGPVTPSVPNPGTNIPASSTTRTVATIGQRGFVGHTMPPPTVPRTSNDPQIPTLLTSLQNGPVTPSAPNPGTNIPASSTMRTVATIGQRGFVGHTMPPPPVPHASHDPQIPTLLTSLQKGPATLSAPNPGTNIPANSNPRTAATIGQKGFVGHTTLLPPSLPSPYTSHDPKAPILLTSL